MRILIGADTYAPDVNGASYFAQRLAAGLAGRGHDVHVVAPSRTFLRPSPASGDVGSITTVGVDAPHRLRRRDPGTVTEHRLVSVPVPRPSGFRVTTPIRLVDRARRVLGRVRPDAVHVQSHVILGRALTLAANDLGIPVIATAHMIPDNLAPHLPLGPALDRARAWFWRAAVEVLSRADTVTAPTPYAARLVESRGVPGPVLPISNGLDLTRFRPDRDPTPFRDRHGLGARPTVGCLGRLDEEKHVEEIVRGFAVLRRDVDAQLLIVGDGDQARRVAAVARDLGVRHDVVMTGALADEEIPDAYAAMDVFVNAGTAELQSLVTLEAMATGKPVVAVDAGALPHLVHHGDNGFRYPHGDHDALAGHLRSLLGDRTAAEHAGSRSLDIVGPHTLEATLSAFETLYAHALRMSNSTRGGGAVPAGRRRGPARSALPAEAPRLVR